MVEVEATVSATPPAKILKITVYRVTDIPVYWYLSHPKEPR